jgi:hypothetical protein
VSAGSYRTLQRENRSLPTFAFYPQLEVSSVLASMNNAKSYVGLSLHIGGWGDGVTEPPPENNYGEIFSFSEVIAGGRIRLGILNEALPTSIWLGFSRHFLDTELIQSAHQRSGPAIDDSYNSLEVGLRIQIPVTRGVLFGLEAQRSFRNWDDGPEMPESETMIYGVVTSFLVGK